MFSHPRDFRKSFYSSLGIQVIEIKQAIETVLQETVIDLDKLRKLCLFFRLPHSHRIILWKMILGILPNSHNCWEFVEKQRHEQLVDLQDAASLLYDESYNKENMQTVLTPRSVVRMTLLKHGLARRYDETRPAHSNIEYLYVIAQAFLDICENQSDAFWIFCLFVRSQNLLTMTYIEQPLGRVQHHVNSLMRELQANDEQFSTFIHEKRLDVDLLAQGWFLKYFAGTLPPYCLERVFDVVLGGSPSILVYVALALLLSQQQRIRALQRKENLAELFKVSDESLDVVLNQAMDMWEKSQSVSIEPKMSLSNGLNTKKQVVVA